MAHCSRNGFAGNSFFAPPFLLLELKHFNFRLGRAQRESDAWRVSPDLETKQKSSAINHQKVFLKIYVCMCKI